jgi:hypothetical protein
VSFWKWKVPGTNPPVYLWPWEWIREFLKTFSSPE